jgi:hypothetical protein
MADRAPRLARGPDRPGRGPRRCHGPSSYVRPPLAATTRALGRAPPCWRTPCRRAVPPPAGIQLADGLLRPAVPRQLRPRRAAGLPPGIEGVDDDVHRPRRHLVCTRGDQRLLAALLPGQLLRRHAAAERLRLRPGLRPDRAVRRQPDRGLPQRRHGADQSQRAEPGRDLPPGRPVRSGHDAPQLHQPGQGRRRRDGGISALQLRPRARAVRARRVRPDQRLPAHLPQRGQRRPVRRWQDNRTGELDIHLSTSTDGGQTWRRPTR